MRQLARFSTSSLNDKFVDAFLQDLEQAGKSRHTVTNYRSDLSHFLGWLDSSLKYVTWQHLRSYFPSLSHLSLASVARKQASLRTFFAWCIRQEILPANPMDKIDPVKIPEKLPRPLENETLDRIFNAIPRQNLRDRLLFTLIRETGLRVSEALNIDLSELTLTPGDEKILIRSAKETKSRMVMLYAAPETLKYLKKYLVQSGLSEGALFRGNESKGGSDKPMHYRSAHYLWQKYCQKAGVSASIHALRHTFATELLNEGVNITVVKTLLGHQNLQTTMRYAEVTDQFIKDELLKKHRRHPAAV